jgi:hypothetical protein
MFPRTLLSLAILATAAFGAALDKRALTCDTNGGSASSFDAEAAARDVMNRGDADCCQNNNGGNSCTNLATAGTASGLFFLLRIYAR